MKIGLITFHETTNYGAILHTYALQRKIQELGAYCEVVNYKCEEIQRRELPMQLRDVHNVRLLFKYILSRHGQRKKYSHFCKFTENKLILSQEIYTKRNICECEHKYDKFVVGSDIVWELNVTNGDFTYYLDFVNDNTKKYAYASSFGYAEIPKKYLSRCKELLSQFQGIAVREQSGKRIIFDLLNRVVQVVLDPTLLLHREEWFEIISFKPQIEKYILIYFTDKDNKIMAFAERLANKTACKIVLISSSIKNIKGVINIKNPSIDEFLGWIRYADYVITASYHGMLFSINFNKQFYYINRTHKDRMETIANELTLQSRDIEYCLDEEFSFINYDTVNRKLEQMRKESLMILGEIVNK